MFQCASPKLNLPYPKITHMPDIPNSPTEHMMQEETHYDSVDTPSGTPSLEETLERMSQAIGLSACMNKMLLKRQREEEEEQTGGKKIKNLRNDRVMLEPVNVNKIGKGSKKHY